MLPKLTKVVNDAIMLMSTCMLVYDGVRNISNHLYYHKITYMHGGIRIMTPNHQFAITMLFPKRDILYSSIQPLHPSVICTPILWAYAYCHSNL